ncbi:MAG: hypothetical protein SVO26_05130 [Chloroflexota bacterium]|nr:hypothetical protein [Chloroflexota bacterium]
MKPPPLQPLSQGGIVLIVGLNFEEDGPLLPAEAMQRFQEGAGQCIVRPIEQRAFWSPVSPVVEATTIDFIPSPSALALASLNVSSVFAEPGESK